MGDTKVLDFGLSGKTPSMRVDTQTGEVLSNPSNGSFGPNLVGALVKAISELTPIAADKTHAKQNWDYVSEHALFSALRPLLSANGLVLLPVAVDFTRGEYQTKQGGSTMRTVEGEVDYMLAHTSGEYILLSTWCEGQSTDDKAGAGALTSALKTILAQMFLISRSGGDSAGVNKQRRNAPPAQPTSFKTAPPPWKPKPTKIDSVERAKPDGGKTRVFRAPWHMQQETSAAGVVLLPYVPFDRDDIGTHVCELSDTALDGDARKARETLRANGLNEDQKSKLQAYLAAVEFELERRHPEPRRTVLEPGDSGDLFSEVPDER